ncbi:hypothetical protein UA75_13810 [Actinoalloteichus sp. GBA129-24]|uniref:Uncharacterized protein n=1 Tax=Actinoalloteichus fjordicus TaxID=1612552 RepID=A0AAC9LCI6_9PSEU|nr:hypothetical protein UA74_13715 [Actinoalloteichus fjordicus]APU20772.1 hypothetical protein UA75_13810 [Actinoalloteichus sp. GBA129-24]
MVENRGFSATPGVARRYPEYVISACATKCRFPSPDRAAASTFRSMADTRCRAAALS